MRLSKDPPKRALHETLSGRRQPVPPIWLMRQAGRYLPEYRKLREKFPSFVEFCLHPEAACEATLQPIARFDFDAAIIFSDILTVPLALGCAVGFGKDSGPAVTLPEGTPLSYAQDILSPVYEGIRLARAGLAPEKSLLGFCGLPWTLLLYMYNLPGEKDFASARRRIAMNRAEAERHIDLLTDACIAHAKAQAAAGADVIQLFESWGGHAPLYLRRRFCVEPAMRVVAALRESAPDVRTVWFAKGFGEAVGEYASQILPHGLSVDAATPLDAVVRRTDGMALQGNLDPYLLFAPEERLQEEARACLRATQGIPYVFNLGHGVLPQTETGKVQKLIETVREGACPG
jgi:uroporphyrinogen decarboxylase